MAEAPKVVKKKGTNVEVVGKWGFWLNAFGTLSIGNGAKTNEIGIEKEEYDELRKQTIPARVKIYETKVTPPAPVVETPAAEVPATEQAPAEVPVVSEAAPVEAPAPETAKE